MRDSIVRSSTKHGVAQNLAERVSATGRQSALFQIGTPDDEVICQWVKSEGGGRLALHEGRRGEERSSKRERDGKVPI